jgi:hypothetical protein
VRAPLAPALLLMAGCAAAQPVADAGTCDADLAAGFVGKAGDQAEAARKAAGAKTVRVVRPGDVVTMEYRADRLTVRTDAAGRIVRTACG